jgi:hypothetical protein
VIVLGWHGNKEVSKGDEVSTWVQDATFARCTTIMIAELAVTSGLGSSLD